MWIDIVKLSLLRTGYFSSVTNVLTSCPKIQHVNKTNFSEHNFLARDQWIWWSCSDADFNSAWPPLPCCFSKFTLKRAFLHIYLTTFSESVISEIQKLWGSSFFSKYSKFNGDFEKEARNWEKVSYCWDNCLWIGIFKYSLLRTGYFSSAANVLTSSPNIYMSIRETFSNLIELAVINEYDKGGVMQISTVFWHAYHFACQRILSNGTF